MFCIIRHGESFTNACLDKVLPNRLCDDTNLLTETGILGAIEAGKLIRQKEEFDTNLIVTSTLSRAIQTGYIIGSMIETGTAFKKYSMFDEIYWHEDGQWERLDESIEWDVIVNDIDWKPYSYAESQRELYDRVVPGFEQLLKRSEHEDVILVTHFFVIRAFLAWYNHKDPNRMIDYTPKNTTPYFF